MVTSTLSCKEKSIIKKGCLVQSIGESIKDTVILVYNVTYDNKFNGVVLHSGHTGHHIGDVYEGLPINGYKPLIGSVTLTQD